MMNVISSRVAINNMVAVEESASEDSRVSNVGRIRELLITAGVAGGKQWFS